MKLKGKATIQIIDAKTGVVKDEVTDENMITHAVENYLNGALNYLMTTFRNGYGGQTDWSNNFRLPNGFLQDLFGGVLIFSSAITEDADHIIPTAAERATFIGCGCQDASLTGDIFRGSINAGETVIGDDYCTFVWDFTTAQSNGDIAAICLTSNAGGGVGYKQNVPEGSYSTEHCMIKALGDGNSKGTMDKTSTGKRVPALTRTKSTESNNRGFLYSGGKIGYVYGDTLYYRDISSALEDFFQLTGKNNRGEIDTTVNEQTITLSQAYYNKWVKVIGDMTYCYTAETDFGWNDSFKLHRYDIDGNETVLTLNLKPLAENMADFYSYDKNYVMSNHTCRFIKDGYLYQLAPFYNNTAVRNDCIRVYKMDLSDSSGVYSVETVFVDATWKSLMNISSSAPSDSTIQVFSFLNDIYFGYSGGNYKAFRLDPNTLTFDGSYSDFACYRDLFNVAGFDNLGVVPWVREPWLGCKNSTALTNVAVTFGGLAVFTPYLATINNLNHVLTKTAADTMKIVYTLTKSVV